MPLQTLDLGRLPYAEALALQRERNAAVARGEAPEVILTVEHDPVITLSQRRGVRDHLLADDAELARLGIDVQQTDRGGDITYHGPGQLVCYPILRLPDHGLNLSRYMRLLEHVVIHTVAAFGITAHPEQGATGVWAPPSTPSPRLAHAPRVPATEPSPPLGNPGPAKLCALGVRIRRHTTLHGLALNVTTDLTHFATIDPCGLGQRPVTSLATLLGDRCPPMPTVREALLHHLRQALEASAAVATGKLSA